MIIVLHTYFSEIQCWAKRQYIYLQNEMSIFMVHIKISINQNSYILQGTQNKKEHAYNQSYARTSAVLPDMGQMEKGRGESHEWALMFMLPVFISC